MFWDLSCGLTYSLSWIMFPCVLEKNMYSAIFGENILHMSVMSSWFIVLSHSLFLFWSSVYLFCPLMKVKYRNLQLLLYNCQFLPTVMSVFASCIVGLCYVCIHIFLLDWPIYQYILSFAPRNSFWPMSVLPDISITILPLFWFYLDTTSFSHFSISAYLCLWIWRESLVDNLQ